VEESEVKRHVVVDREFVGVGSDRFAIVRVTCVDPDSHNIPVSYESFALYTNICETVENTRFLSLRVRHRLVHLL
jgi:hypothetical protein